MKGAQVSGNLTTESRSIESGQGESMWIFPLRILLEEDMFGTTIPPGAVEVWLAVGTDVAVVVDADIAVSISSVGCADVTGVSVVIDAAAAVSTLGSVGGDIMGISSGLGADTGHFFRSRCRHCGHFFRSRCRHWAFL